MIALLLIATWFLEIAAAPSPVGSPAHVLFREESVVAEASGRQTTTTRAVIRILTAEGSTAARGGERSRDLHPNRVAASKTRIGIRNMSVCLTAGRPLQAGTGSVHPVEDCQYDDPEDEDHRNRGGVCG